MATRLKHVLVCNHPNGFKFLIKTSMQKGVFDLHKSVYVLINNYYDFNARYNDTLWKQLPLAQSYSIAMGIIRVA